MTRRTFPDSHLVSWQGFELEIVENRPLHDDSRLDRLREEVLGIAALSRGWDDPETMRFFRDKFKIEPLYEANGLVLVYQRDVLVGLAGTVNNWPVKQGSIVHLCSLGLMPQVQRRGLLQAFMSLLWLASLRDPRVRHDFLRGALYATAITQSPYILGLIQRVADLFPSPDRAAPRADEREIAEQVLARFDPHTLFDTESFILRSECEFRYRRAPLSLDRRLTHFCNERLRYNEGDVFLAVGTVRQSKLSQFLEQQRRVNADLLDTLLEAVLEKQSFRLLMPVSN